MRKIIPVSFLLVFSLLVHPVTSRAANFWNLTDIGKSAKVVVTASYNSGAGLQTVSYTPTKFGMKIERRDDTDDPPFTKIYTNVTFSNASTSSSAGTSFTASMTGSGVKTVATTLFAAAVNNDLEDITNTSTDYPRFDFRDDTSGRKLAMSSDAMLSSIAEGSFIERGKLIDITIKYTVMGTVTVSVNGLDYYPYPAKISIAVTAKGIPGEDAP